ncbi:hypothetical protein GCM10025876_37050 [Demequina litorisediminis]|uniref:Triosephosphate isomerase n=1 Tax=Demequina litorisediminis TaxID=1849022 RepID=A0ABQ6IK82_9MICO|nr:hypothetical protein GCM10025876_37050 [Demequina litorisediminis]
MEVAVLASFTSIRSVQTLVDADKARVEVRRPGHLAAHLRCLHRRGLRHPGSRSLGVSYVAVGHSERREYHGESDEVVAAKTKAAFENGIVPIVCVGEGLDVRKEGRQVEYTLAQVDGALKDLPADKAKDVVIAYEPVWAIGTGEVATPADAQEVCGAIRARLAEPVRRRALPMACACSTAAP